MSEGGGRAGIEALKRQAPLGEVARSHGVELRNGGEVLAGHCPFCETRAPTFVVGVDERYRCGGCQATGDVIDFVRRVRGVSFGGALALLGGRAARAGEVTGGPRRRAQEPSRRELGREDHLLLAAAAETYHEALLREERALAYLEQRAIPEWVARSCRLGYAGGDELAVYLRRRRMSLVRAHERLGLLSAGGEEELAGRLVIPELAGGRVRWMAGRRLDERPPRYRALALPRPVLGLERARGRRRLVVVDGPFEWLTLVAWNVGGCAVLESRASPRQLAELRRAGELVVVAGSAGPRARAQRALAEALGERAWVLELPDGAEDLNALAREAAGRALFMERLRAGRGHVPPP